MGNGRTALKYLIPYIFRVAIRNRRLVKLENDQVAFRYRARDTGQLKLCTLSAEAFIHRFLQHLLPKLRVADALTAHHSTYRTLPIMSKHVFAINRSFMLDAGFHPCASSLACLVLRKMSAAICYHVTTRIDIGDFAVQLSQLDWQ